MKRILFFLIILLSGYAFSQDIIITKDGKEHKVIIKEITDKQIKYVDYKDPEGVVFTIDKVLVKEIHFHTGNKMKMEAPEENEWYFADDKINNLMFNFSAFGGNTLGIAYERALAPGQSLFFEGKIYGLGLPARHGWIMKRSGFGLTMEYRVRLKSLFSADQYRPLHVMHGSYLAPGIGFSYGEYKAGYYDYYEETQTSIVIRSHTIFHFGIHVGKEYVIRRVLTFDVNIGLHYYVGEDEGFGIRIGNFIGGDGILFGYNVRIGFLFGKDRLVDKYHKQPKPPKYSGQKEGNPKFY